MYICIYIHICITENRGGVYEISKREGICKYIHKYIHIYIYTYVCIYTYIYTYAYLSTEEELTRSPREKGYGMLKPFGPNFFLSTITA
jgi:hypothetical protein